MNQDILPDSALVVLHRRNRAFVAGGTDRPGRELGEWLFLPSIAGLSWLEVYRSATGAHWILLVLWLLCASVLTAATFAIFRSGAQVRRGGRLITATIIAVEKQVTIIPYPPVIASEITVRYRFTTPEGKEQTGKVKPTRNRRALSPGNHLAILYLNGAARVM